MKKLAVLAVLALPIAACSTVSFAPPGVEVLYADDDQRHDNCPFGRARNRVRAVTVSQDVAGALKVLDAYIAAYNCNSREAADGRQAFEVPAQVTTTGTITAAALGASTQVPIVGAAVNSLLMAGRGYYDPKQKSAIYTHALDALHCIQNEAVGIDNFAAFQKKSEQDAVERARNKAIFSQGGASPSTVSVPVEQQYFIMVTNAARSVGNIALTRLSNVGTFDPAGTAAELEKIIAEIDAEKEKKEKAEKETEPKPATDNGAQPGAQTGPGTAAAAMSAGLAELRRQRMVELDLKLLHPELQACIWRAKV